MDNMASTSITRITDSGEVSEILELTQEEFDQITSEYGIGKRFEKIYVHYSEALAQAQAATFPDEELKEENFNRVNTDGFEKAVVLMNCWAAMAQRVMFEKHNFRIEINYNAEAKKTDFAIYTSTKDDKADIQQEHSEN